MSELNLKAALAEVEKGKSFCLESKGDIGKVLRALMGEKPKPDVTYSTGDTFDLGDGTAWLLAKIDHYPCKATLINMKDGIRWGEGARVEDLFEITHDEFAEICGREHGFTKKKGEWTWNS